jgi:membrane associated rhomboid family serine protease
MIASTLTSSYLSMPVTSILMLVIFINSIIGFFLPQYFIKLILHPHSVFQENEFYRLATADLVHNDLFHLVINEFLLFFVCGKLERYLNSRSALGSISYAAIYFASLITASFFVSFINRRNIEYSSTGASGSILGCLSSFLILQPLEVGFFLPGIGPVNNITTAFIVYAYFVYYQFRTKQALLNHELHFFGSVGGTLATLAIVQPF